MTVKEQLLKAAIRPLLPQIRQQLTPALETFVESRLKEIEERKPYIRSFEKVKKMQASVNRKAKQNPHYHQRMKQ